MFGNVQIYEGEINETSLRGGCPKYPRNRFLAYE